MSAVRGEGVCPVRTFFGQAEREEILQMRMSALFGAKIIGFFEIYGVSARTRGEGRGQFFAIVRGRPLWTAPNQAWLC